MTASPAPHSLRQPAVREAQFRPRLSAVSDSRAKEKIVQQYRSADRASKLHGLSNAFDSCFCEFEIVVSLL